ncbi:Senescence regulator [Quillaja saponaria]|uniref:Senescence regulator n=1 Tax=Quillaja saponaria TaxID=32244 RepID=A0AAD7Q782_QUISA|nr:Senescence regulator [Quillaja saponaria]
MEHTSFSHRRSTSSSDRLLGLFNFSPPSTTITGDELNEADFFWTGDVSESNQQPLASPVIDKNRRPSFNQPQKSGILAVLPEPDYRFPDRPVLCRKPSISSSSSRMIPSIPRPPDQNSQERDCFFQSEPPRNFQQSAPVKIPILSSKLMASRKNGEFADVDDEIEDDEILPPHELVARGSGVSPRTTFSVLEGVGRTLKGRDLRQVRNAIWRKTGFLD